MSMKLSLDKNLVEKLNKAKKVDIITSNKEDLDYRLDLFVREIDKKLQPKRYDELCCKRTKTLEAWEQELQVVKNEGNGGAKPFLNILLDLSSSIVSKTKRMPSGMDYTLRAEANAAKEKINEANNKIEMIIKSLGHNYANDHKSNCQNDDLGGNGVCSNKLIKIADISETLSTHYSKIDKHLSNLKK